MSSRTTGRRRGRPRKVTIEVDCGRPGLNLALELLTRLSLEPVRAAGLASALGVTRYELRPLSDWLDRVGIPVTWQWHPARLSIEPEDWLEAQRMAEEYYDTVYPPDR